MPLPDNVLVELVVQLRETRTAIDNMCALLADLQRNHVQISADVDSQVKPEAPSPDCSLVW
jgi:hypothetical protein